MGFTPPSSFDNLILYHHNSPRRCSMAKIKMADLPHKLELSSAYYDYDWTDAS